MDEHSLFTRAHSIRCHELRLADKDLFESVLRARIQKLGSDQDTISRLAKLKIESDTEVIRMAYVRAMTGAQFKCFLRGQLSPQEWNRLSQKVISSRDQRTKEVLCRCVSTLVKGGEE